ncbi:hypothetical protein J4437_00365 [Candidatus Woesearchaeota archaeon]|nr:hypothetical protein [Candidatus Woesearchaeota archaeon]
MGRILVVDAAENYRQMIKKIYTDSLCATSIGNARQKVDVLKGDKDLSVVVMEITGVTVMDYSIPDFIKDMKERQELYLPFVAFTNASMIEAVNKTRKLEFDGLFSKRCYPQMYESLKKLTSHPEFYRNSKITSFQEKETKRDHSRPRRYNHY